MTNNMVDPWVETLTASGGIEGLHLKCAKGVWYLDGVQIAVGAGGLKIVIIMPTATHGAVKWQDQEIIGRTPLQRYEDAAPSSDFLEEGWNPYTQFLCVGADEKHIGQLMTFTSSSWSGRRAFKDQIGPYLRKAKRQFPIVTLGSKPRRNDPNGNIDPTFAIVDWAARGDFADMLLPGPETQPALLEAPLAPAAVRKPAVDRRALQTVTSSRQPARPHWEPPPIGEDDVNVNRAIDDGVPL
jgi:hypothetical protein